MSDFNETFFDIFSENLQIKNFMKIRPVGTELFYADGRTDMTKLIFAFHNFANAPKKVMFKHGYIHGIIVPPVVVCFFVPPILILNQLNNEAFTLLGCYTAFISS